MTVIRVWLPVGSTSTLGQTQFEVRPQITILFYSLVPKSGTSVQAESATLDESLAFSSVVRRHPAFTAGAKEMVTEKLVYEPA